MLRGWFDYFKHAHSVAQLGIDGFVRRRLRAILRKQEKRPGMGRVSPLTIFGGPILSSRHKGCSP